MANNNPRGAVAPIALYVANFGGIPVTCCDARTLHAGLQNKRAFSEWMRTRIKQYWFVAGIDFEPVTRPYKGAFAGRGGDRRSKDFHLSLSMARDLCQLEKTERGSEIRTFFIEQECKSPVRPAHAAPPTLTSSEIHTLRGLVDRRCAEVGAEQQGAVRAEVWSRLQNQFCVTSHECIERRKMADACVFIVTLELSAAKARALPEREPITANDEQNIQKVIGAATGGMAHQKSWQQAVWLYLRRELQHPSPQPFYVDQLAEIQKILGHVLGVATKVHEIMHSVQAQAAREIFRQGTLADIVLPALAQSAHAAMAELRHATGYLSRMDAERLSAIGRRKKGPTMSRYVRAEQPDYFQKTGA